MEPSILKNCNRFVDPSITGLCALAKELNKLTVEQLDLPLLKELVRTKDEKLGSIKRLERFICSLGDDGRKLTAPLVGINELRQGDAHLPSEDIRDSLQLLGIIDDGNFVQMAKTMICQVAWSIGITGNLIIGSYREQRP
jgi:hypothetical protein